MLPDIHIFDNTLHWYSFFHWLGVAMGVLFGLYYTFKNKANIQLNIIQTIGFFLSLYILFMIGGRSVGFVEFYLYEGVLPDVSTFFQGPSAGNFRWCGSLLAVILFLPIIANKILKIKTFNAFFDMLVLSFCVLTIFTKQGCQFSGDGCYGIPTNLPWGMYYPYGSAPNILPVHPTPIYDSLFHCLFFVFLFYWDSRFKKFEGQTAFIYFVGVSVFYILLELIRLNPVIAWDITLPQLVYFFIVIGSMTYFKTALPKPSYY